MPYLWIDSTSKDVIWNIHYIGPSDIRYEYLHITKSANIEGFGGYGFRLCIF